ncbi:MAG TPA: hypothetical protein VLE99_00890 [Candidatus Saccharimonadales bacterium]|nr:hypothetical protein [Candidatus Saccharimonadales bacterium]
MTTVVSSAESWPPQIVEPEPGDALPILTPELLVGPSEQPAPQSVDGLYAPASELVTGEVPTVSVNGTSEAASDSGVAPAPSVFTVDVQRLYRRADDSTREPAANEAAATPAAGGGDIEGEIIDSTTLERHVEAKPHPVGGRLARYIGRPALKCVAGAAAFATVTTDTISDAIFQPRSIRPMRFQSVTHKVDERMLELIRNWRDTPGIGLKMYALLAAILPAVNFGPVETGEMVIQGKAMDAAHAANITEALPTFLIGAGAAGVTGVVFEGIANWIIRNRYKPERLAAAAAAAAKGEPAPSLTLGQRINSFIYGFGYGSPYPVSKNQGEGIGVSMAGYQLYALGRSALLAFSTGAALVADSPPVTAGVTAGLVWMAAVSGTHDTLGEETRRTRAIDAFAHWAQRTIAGFDDKGRKRFEPKRKFNLKLAAATLETPQPAELVS